MVFFMIIQILSVGESKNPYLKEGESDFIQRLKHYCRLEIRTVKEEKIPKNQGAEFVQESEAKRILCRQIFTTATVPPVRQAG